MAITDIEIEDTLRVGAPSIKYEGKDTTPANPTLIAGPDRYQRILEDLINELEGQLGRELTDAEYDEVGKEAYDRFHSGDYAEGGPVDYSKDANYKGWKKTYETNPDAAAMNENHATYLKYYNREKKAYGGIMGLDGRRQYGIGSWFQEKIMDPIKKNPIPSAAAAAAAAYLGNKYLPESMGGGKLDNVFKAISDKASGVTTGIKEILGKERKLGDTTYTLGDKITEGIGRSIIPIAGGLTAGLFADKIDKPEEIGLDRGTGVGIQNVRKVANLLDQQQGVAAGLNFLPDVAARKFSPTEMAIAYGDTETKPIEQLAYGGRTGYAQGDRVTAQELVRRMQQINMEMLEAEGNEIVQLMRESLAIRDRLKKLKQKGVDVEEIEDEIKLSFGRGPKDEVVEQMTFMEGVEDAAGQPVVTSMGTFETPKRKPEDTDRMAKTLDYKADFMRPEVMKAASMKKPRAEMPDLMRGRMKKPEELVESIRELIETVKPRPRRMPGDAGDPMGEAAMIGMAEGGIMNLGGMEKDYRNTGGFVEIGAEEKLDDVPARLSVNEFVFTADAVRGAGDGDVDEGAKRLQGIMKELEKRGQQGQDMIDVSERLSEVTA